MVLFIIYFQIQEESEGPILGTSYKLHQNFVEHL